MSKNLASGVPHETSSKAAGKYSRRQALKRIAALSVGTIGLCPPSVAQSQYVSHRAQSLYVSHRAYGSAAFYSSAYVSHRTYSSFYSSPYVSHFP